MIFPQRRESALFVPSYLPTKRLLLRVKSEGRRAGEAEPSYTPIALLAQDKKAFIFLAEQGPPVPDPFCFLLKLHALNFKAKKTNNNKK